MSPRAYTEGRSWGWAITARRVTGGLLLPPHPQPQRLRGSPTYQPLPKPGKFLLLLLSSVLSAPSTVIDGQSAAGQRERQIAGFGKSME